MVNYHSDSVFVLFFYIFQFILQVPIATITIWVIIIKNFVKSNDKYMGHNYQDFDIFQRQFLIGLYVCSSRKIKGTRAQHDTNQCLLRHSLSHIFSCCETSSGRFYKIIENNFNYSIVAGHIFPDSIIVKIFIGTKFWIYLSQTCFKNEK